MELNIFYFKDIFKTCGRIPLFAEMTSMCCLPLRPLPIDSLLKLMATTQGRDKLYRLVQYFSRFLAFYLSKMCPSAEFVKRLQKLSVSVGLARKRNQNYLKTFE